jgi:vancomycin resistance protein YoaR
MKKYILSVSFVLIFFSTNFIYSDMSEKVIIASFSTSVASQSSNVKQNIAIASGRLDGLVIPGRTTFSFNDIVGEGSAKNGFLSGRVLYLHRKAYESGGGICQVSSTLFNALLMSGFIIKERHRHYQPVSYVPLGLDATIKYGKKDLRLKNPFKHNIYISLKMNDKSLNVTVYSKIKIKYKYEIYTEEEEVEIPFSNLDENIRTGISVFVYRKKIYNNNIIGSYLLYKDYYPPVYIK